MADFVCSPDLCSLLATVRSGENIGNTDIGTFKDLQYKVYILFSDSDSGGNELPLSAFGFKPNVDLES